MEVFGWISSICLGICALPQAIKCYRQGHAEGIDYMFLGLWTLGEIAGIIYVIYINSLPLIVNYSFNLVLLSIIIKYILYPRRGTE